MDILSHCRSTMSKTSMEIHKSHMSEEMKREALQVALLAVNMYEKGNDIALYIKKEFDRKHGKYWHCIIGKFSASVSYNTDSYISFSVDGKNILLFKTD
ncbi:dynein light chain-like [Megalobrama amblycephala]|uniref:dynein light chain-like n=1 Tax=Megalobrama amblycephala TaxID=75352 RepID=UPI0020145BE0|nr:dynein light chain-like [Megalobrama amblycephala]